MQKLSLFTDDFSCESIDIARWRRDYNDVRPHSAIGRIPSAQFAAAHRRCAGDVPEPKEII